ncbi:MAG: ROK family transcriptional regulator [Lachnospiraceae bacterium]|jgi:predicted NBD/HSP70 family sugar kinase|nr:ROK family transcriptional regulator [Lachnospiraceae bacterium]
MSKGVALNAARMKNRNIRRVMEELRISPFSRSQLATRMGLSRAAISSIVDSLIQENVVIEGDVIASNTAGRSRTPLFWNSDAFFCVGVILRRGYFGVSLYKFDGTLIYVERKNIDDSYSHASHILADIYKMIDGAIIKYKPKGRLLGIGVGAPGPLNAKAGVIENPTNLRILHKTPIIAPLHERYHCPVVMANDACAMALAELSFGVKDRYNNYFVLEVTGGIGGGLVLDQKVIRGAYGNGNEVGHSTLNIFGERCQCGNVGCAELYATVDAIVQKAHKYNSKLKSWKDIVDAAEAGETFAADVIKEEAFYLSSLCINLLNAFEIQAILLSGIEICYQPYLLIQMIQEQIPGRLLLKKNRKIDILPSSLDENADALSAANLAIDNYLETFEVESY